MQSLTLPPLKPCSSPQAVIDEHFDALNKGDWERAIAQYPDNVEIFLQGGDVIKGRKDVGQLFWGFLKPRSEGGLRGIQFETLHSFRVDDTFHIQWRVTGDFLAEPYIGSDSYAVKDGLLWAQVSTLKFSDLKFK